MYRRKRSVNRRNRYIAIALTSSLGLMVGMWLPSPQAKAPPSDRDQDPCLPTETQVGLRPINVEVESVETLPESPTTERCSPTPVDASGR